MRTIDDIIKQAVAEAGLRPAGSNGTPESIKSASGNSLADNLYKLAAELESLGDVPVGQTVVKKADDTLRQLAKTFIYQQALKKASADRMEVEEVGSIEKLAAHVEAQGAYLDCFEKVAYMNLEDVENYMGGYLPDKDEVGVRKSLEDRKANSFILRHPWLTGIPTLGIAPAIVHNKAMNEIASKVLRSNPALAKKIRQERLEEFKLDTERSKAEQAERTASAVMSGLGNIASRVV